MERTYTPSQKEFDADNESKEKARLCRSDKVDGGGDEITSKNTIESKSVNIVYPSGDTSLSPVLEKGQIKDELEPNMEVIPDIPKMSDSVKEMYLNRGNETRCITRPVIKST